MDLPRVSAGDRLALFILVILQIADVLALLPGPSLGLTPLGPAQALFKTTTRFVLQLELFRV
ncbi:hypothetical protein C3432_01865 [Citrobacter amalonaticus]|uniref:Uncharacterized protein n=1 Tax=Citrobacter amalonaticus TaxID=35703 RepID=A0A2S4S2H7_CITAM|nr:hypothetical protein C3432_01865 [Citrobacter amalonaticus]POT77623.1 hypothetical protein C3436_09535 [Citrobacter amalonaticus]POU68075.1 hypothetical protein C3430_03070 [Citrobacter amalonaticus]POV07679.1 hypothetical protein C3424_03080 [Citrobacter amalonaticus]